MDCRRIERRFLFEINFGFFFGDPTTAEIYTLPLHDALPISFCSPQYGHVTVITVSALPSPVSKSSGSSSKLSIMRVLSQPPPHAPLVFTERLPEFCLEIGFFAGDHVPAH